MPVPASRPVLSRRRFLTLAGGGIALAGAGAGAVGLTRLTAGSDLILSGDPAVLLTERTAQRTATGNTVTRTLTAAPTTVDLGGVTVDTWAYDGQVPGALLRATAGDLLDITVNNQLPDPTTVHWHGLALRNDMDGVPGVTQPLIAPAASRRYQFLLRHPGTYWFHPHHGTQLDRGLYAPLLIDDPRDLGDYDHDELLILDDWLDGTGTTPDQELARLRQDGMTMTGMDMGMGGMDMSGAAGIDPNHPLGTDTGDVDYPHYLINGRVPTAPQVITAKPGDRIRLRLINAGADTAFRFAAGGHRLTVIASDGYPVLPMIVDQLIIGMGERYDVVITAGDGAFPFVARPEGKDGLAMAVLRTASGDSPSPDQDLNEFTGTLLSYTDLNPATDISLPTRQQDRSLTVDLGMTGRYTWTLNGKTYADRQPLLVRQGERVRITFRNRTSMFHPMHLHGHTFALTEGGARKDTVNVLPGRALAIDLDTDNPGQWLLHCHNLYHGETGMMTLLSYQQP